MSDFADYLEQKIMDHVFNRVDYDTAAQTTWVALYTSATADAGTGTEVTGGSYAREQVGHNSGTPTPKWALAAVNGTAYRVDNVQDIVYTQASASWGTVGWTAIIDASSAGNWLAHGALTASKVVDNGDTFKFNAGDLDIDLD
jgi:hypothetical protein